MVDDPSDGARHGSPIVSSGVLRAMTFGYDGDGGLGDRLIAAVLRGEKTATSSTAAEHLSGVEPLPRVGEREGFADAAAWRTAHAAFWHEVTDEIRADCGDPTWSLRQSEPIVVEWFRLLETTG